MVNLSAQATMSMHFPSSIKRYHLPIAVLAAISSALLGSAPGLAKPAGVPANAATMPRCPVQIETQQSLKGSAAGWTEERRDESHRLEAVSLFAGPVAQIVELAPDDPVKSRYNVAPAGNRRDSVNMVCQYRSTDVKLTRPVPRTAKLCQFVEPRNADVTAVILRCW